MLILTIDFLVSSVYSCSLVLSRLHSPKAPSRRFLMNLGSKFRYSGRTEFQASAPHLDQSTTGSLNKSTKFPRTTPSRKTLPLTLESGQISRPGSGDKRAPRLASPETSSIGSSVHSNGALKPLKPTAPTMATIIGDYFTDFLIQHLSLRFIQ